MNYRGFADRQISVYAAMLIITIAGACATLAILHMISTIDFAYTDLPGFTT